MGHTPVPARFSLHGQLRILRTSTSVRLEPVPGTGSEPGQKSNRRRLTLYRRLVCHVSFAFGSDKERSQTRNCGGWQRSGCSAEQSLPPRVPKALLSTEEASVLYEGSRSLEELPGVDRTRSHSEFHEPGRSDALGERYSEQCLAGKKQSG